MGPARLGEQPSYYQFGIPQVDLPRKQSEVHSGADFPKIEPIEQFRNKADNLLAGQAGRDSLRHQTLHPGSPIVPFPALLAIPFAWRRTICGHVPKPRSSEVRGTSPLAGMVGEVVRSSKLIYMVISIQLIDGSRRMNLDQLRSFRAVAEEGGFSRAAEALFLTQSTISMQVAALERELGVRLFERLGRRVVLTHAGDAMLGYAVRILSQVDESRRTMTSFRGLEAGELVVGASLTIGSYLVPELFGLFHRQHPGIRLLLEIAPTPRQVGQIASGKLDLGLVEGPIHGPEFMVEPFRTDQLALIVPPGHRWAARESVAAGELEGEPFLEREPTSGTREIVQGRLAALGIRLTPVLEMGSPEALKRAVRAGLGVAIVSSATVELELKAGLLIALPVTGVELSRPFYIVIHRDRYISAPLSAFVDLLHATYSVYCGIEPAFRWPAGAP